MVQKARVGDDPLQLDSIEARVTLQLLPDDPPLALLSFLYLTNKGILGMMGLKTLSFSKTRTPLRVTLTSSPGS
jgi:hypothetical protein